MRRIGVFVIAAAMILPAALYAEGVRNGRKYVENERQVLKLKKQLVKDQREVSDFESLLGEMDALRNADAMRQDFWDVNADIRSAMEREHRQARERIGETQVGVSRSKPEAHMTAGAQDHVQALDDQLDAQDDWRVRSTAADRANRMGAIIKETHGLQQVMAVTGDSDLFQRYRFLLGEFLDVMHADVDAAIAELDDDRDERGEDR